MINLIDRADWLRPHILVVKAPSTQLIKIDNKIMQIINLRIPAMEDQF